MTTTDLSLFGYREKQLLIELLKAEIEQGLPADFENDNITPMMNQNSGNVFLTNSNYQVTMINNGKLESFYTLPYGGAEGFAFDLIEEYKNGNITHKEDIEELRRILKENNLGRLPKKSK